MQCATFFRVLLIKLQQICPLFLLWQTFTLKCLDTTTFFVLLDPPMIKYHRIRFLFFPHVVPRGKNFWVRACEIGLADSQLIFSSSSSDFLFSSSSAHSSCPSWPYLIKKNDDNWEKRKESYFPKKMFLVCCCQKQKVLYTSCQRYLTFFEICGGIVRVSCCNFFPRKIVHFIRNDMRSRVVQHNIELFKKGARFKFAACIVHFHDG